MPRIGWARAVLVAIAMALLSARAADAHGVLQSSVPASKARLKTVPREIRLTFNEAPELAFTQIELVGPDSISILLGAPRALADSARVVLADIQGAIARAGVYRVNWRIAGRDGHPVRGTFTFTIVEGASGLGVTRDSVVEAPSLTARDSAVEAESGPSLPVTSASSEPSQDKFFDASSPLYVAIRWLSFTGLTIVLGAVAFALLVVRLFEQRRGDAVSGVASQARSRAASIGLGAALIFVVAAFARLHAQSLALADLNGDGTGGVIARLLTQTTWGTGWLIQIAAIVVAIAGFMVARRGRAAGWTIAAIGALALAVTPALTGHAAALSSLAPVAIIADAVHVGSAGGWLGSLLLVLVAGMPAALAPGTGDRDVADLVNAFSTIALRFAAALGLTGLIAAWLQVGSFPALWESGYGRTLLLKLAIASVVLAIGAYNWRRVRPALGEKAGAALLRRSATAELAIGAAVLVITAMLVGMETPRS
ncbi:MAG: copper resistance protein CopC/CopD [Anaerolineae bacterium]|nr:copper resistance protein CopC/CopD [Gemmatimonadaceae bacterium]